VYGGHEQHTFYSKSCLSGNGKYLISGSSDDHAYIWKIGQGPQPFLKLEGHGAEVTCVAWSSTDITKVALFFIYHDFRFHLTRYILNVLFHRLLHVLMMFAIEFGD